MLNTPGPKSILLFTVCVCVCVCVVGGGGGVGVGFSFLSFFFCILILCNIPMRLFPMGNHCAVPEANQLPQSDATQPTIIP